MVRYPGWYLCLKEMSESCSNGHKKSLITLAIAIFILCPLNTHLPSPLMQRYRISSQILILGSSFKVMSRGKLLPQIPLERV